MPFAEDFINAFHAGRQMRQQQQLLAQQQEDHALNVDIKKHELSAAKLAQKVQAYQANRNALLQQPVQSAPPLFPEDTGGAPIGPGFQKQTIQGVQDSESGLNLPTINASAADLQAQVRQQAAQAAAAQPFTLTAAPGATSVRIVNGRPIASVSSPAKPAEGEMPLGPQRVAQLNATMAATYAQANNGAAMPDIYKLPANATQKDFDRLDRQLDFISKAAANKTQRDLVNEMRRTAQQTAKDAHDDRQEQNELKWVEYTDPISGRGVAGPLSMAHAAGATDASLVPTEEIRNIKDARQVVHMVNKNGSTPESQGILQLIDGLDKDGKLGVAASRINSFLAGKVGAEPGDDPRIMALLNKTELAASLSMKSHFGAAGGRSPQMLQHFLDMANAKTMNANTLRAGVKSLSDYMGDRAKLPAAQVVDDNPYRKGK